VVVVAGVAIGLLILVELNPLDGDHKYDVPPEAIKVVGEPLQTVTLLPVLTTGNGSTVTITEFDAEPQEFVTVMV